MHDPIYLYLISIQIHTLYSCWDLAAIMYYLLSSQLQIPLSTTNTTTTTTDYNFYRSLPLLRLRPFNIHYHLYRSKISSFLRTNPVISWSTANVITTPSNIYTTDGYDFRHYIFTLTSTTTISNRKDHNNNLVWTTTTILMAWWMTTTTVAWMTTTTIMALAMTTTTTITARMTTTTTIEWQQQQRIWCEIKQQL